jgi:hypothetical protein
MKKRAAAALLWVYIGWYAGSLLAEMFGASSLIGLLPGIATAVVVLRPLEGPRPLAFGPRTTAD